MSPGAKPVLGIIALDEPDATEESSAQLAERGAVTPWLIEDPSFWPVPFRRAIARGADPAANKVPTPEAASGIVEAARRLDRETQLVIGNCGYMWASREQLRGETATPAMTSGLDLLDLALQMTNRPVGVITWDEAPLVPLLRDHPGWDRIRLLGVGDLSSWRKSISLSDYGKPAGWTLDEMERQFTQRLADAFGAEGVFEDVGILVIECTAVANFRSAIRSVTPLPVLDIVHFAEAALKMTERAVDGGLERAAETIVDRSLAVRPGEATVVVGAPETHDVAMALWRASRDRGAAAVLVTVDGDLDGEPSAPVAAALAAADVFLVATPGSLSHTQARAAATERGARGATMPGVTAEMLARTMSADFDATRARSEAVAQLLTDADAAHLTCPRGTDLLLDIAGRQGLVDDIDLSAKHAFGNLPAGEGAISPKGGSGRVAVMSVTPAGILPEPMMLTVEDGRLVSADGTYGADFLELMSAHGATAMNLAELGVGTNDAAVLTGNVLEDEKVVGTAHVAFGASSTIGGTVRASIHRDVVVFDATLTIGDTRVLDGGRWALR